MNVLNDMLFWLFGFSWYVTALIIILAATAAGVILLWVLHGILPGTRATVRGFAWLGNRFATWSESTHRRRLELIEQIAEAKIGTDMAEAEAFAVRQRAEAEALTTAARAYALKKQAKAYAKAVKAELRERKATQKNWLLKLDPFRRIKKWGPILVVALVGLMLIGIALDNIWLWTLCPWLVILSWRFYSNSKKEPGDRRTFLKVFMPRMSALWIGSWLIFLIANLTRR